MRRGTARAGRGRWLLATALATATVTGGLTATLPRTAWAHPQFTSTGSNRYVKLTLLGGGALRIAYTVMVGEVPAAAARRAADSNHDGVVDPGEQAAAAAALERAVDAGLTVEVDGARARVAWDTPSTGFSSDAKVGPLPFSIDLVGRIDAGPGAHLVRLDDTTPLADLAETEIRLEEGPATRITSAWQGHEDNGRVTRFLFQGPKYSALEDRSIALRYTDARPSTSPPGRPATRSLLLPAAALLLLTAGATTLLLLRRRRNPSP